MKGTERKLSNNSTKHSISKEQLQGGPLTKQDILDVHANVFTRIGKFPGIPYKFQNCLTIPPNIQSQRSSFKAVH